jgi:hypothetical protein
MDRTVICEQVGYNVEMNRWIGTCELHVSFVVFVNKIVHCLDQTVIVTAARLLQSESLPCHHMFQK